MEKKRNWSHTNSGESLVLGCQAHFTILFENFHDSKNTYDFHTYQLYVYLPNIPLGLVEDTECSELSTKS